MPAKLLSALVGLVLLVTWAPAADPVVKTYTVARVKAPVIQTSDEVLLKVDAKTKITQKTATGEKDAKLDDIKEGSKIEVHTEKGAEGINKIVIQ